MGTQLRHGLNGMQGCLPRFTTKGQEIGVLIGSDGRTPCANQQADEPSGDRITAKLLHDLVEQQEHKCALSGRHLTPQSATLDHINPLCDGGIDAMSNVQIVDHAVNQAKGSMTNEQFIAMCREVAWWCRGTMGPS